MKSFDENDLTTFIEPDLTTFAKPDLKVRPTAHRISHIAHRASPIA